MFDGPDADLSHIAPLPGGGWAGIRAGSFVRYDGAFQLVDTTDAVFDAAFRAWGDGFVFYGESNGVPWIARTDGELGVQWQAQPVITGSQTIIGLDVTSDGGLVAYAEVKCAGADSFTDVAFMRLAAAGTILWIGYHPMPRDGAPRAMRVIDDAIVTTGAGPLDDSPWGGPEVLWYLSVGVDGDDPTQLPGILDVSPGCEPLVQP